MMPVAVPAGMPGFRVVTLQMCRQIELIRASQELCLEGLLNRFRVEGFPATLPPVCYYAEVTGFAGPLAVRFAVRHEHSDRQVFIAEWEKTIPTPASITQVFGVTRTIAFDAPGTYEFEMVVQRAVVSRRHFTVNLIGSADDLGSD